MKKFKKVVKFLLKKKVLNKRKVLLIKNTLIVKGKKIRSKIIEKKEQNKNFHKNQQKNVTYEKI